MQGITKIVIGFPLVKGRIDGRLFSAVNMALKQVLRGMRYVEKRRPLLRKAIDEQLGVKFRPLNMWKFFDEGINSGRPRHVVKGINSERCYECFSEIAIRAGNNRIKPAAPENT